MRITQTQLIEKAVFELMKNVGTSIPAYVQSFDPATQLAEIQVAVQRVDVEGNVFTPPPIIKVPVVFLGGKFCVEFEINSGDEGLLIVSQRCIDAWKNQGGIAPNPVARFHDMQDGIFLPGARSQAKKLTNFENNGIRIRDESADSYVWLKNAGDVEVKGASFKGIFSGAVDIESSSLTHNGVNVGEDHQHDDSGTYNASGTPVTGTSGTPL